MSADRIRSLQRWLIRIHDESTAMMDAAEVYQQRVGFSKLRQLALEALDNPQGDRLQRMRDGLANE